MNRLMRHARFLSTKQQRVIPSDGKSLSDFVNSSPSKTEEPMMLRPVGSPLISPLNFHIETYGCQMNSSDSEIVRSILLQEGYHEVESNDTTDIILINTCAIRENAEDRIWKRLRHLRSLKRQNEPKIALLGCMAERLKSKLLDPKTKLVDVVAGPDAYRDLPNLLDIVCNGNTTAMNVQLSLDETYADITPVRSNPNSVSAFVSCMRGCANVCSYCIVPFVRSNRERSMALESVVDHVRELSDNGVKEIVLLGQNVNSYHDRSSPAAQENGRGYIAAKGFNNMFKNRDQIGYRFVDLLYHCSQVNTEVRFRFTSPHPKDFPDDVLDLIAETPNICNAIHMPAQSGSTSVLERMRRGYSREAYLELVDRIRNKIPDVALCSDFITGFCGETPQEHRDTVSLMEQVVYDNAFMFAYSMRDKTHAYHRMKDDVPQQVKLQRLQEIIQTFGTNVERKNFQQETGRYHVVLVEGFSRRSTVEAPELSGLTDTNKRCVFKDFEMPVSIESSFSSDLSIRATAGDYVLVRIEEAGRNTLKGVPVARTTLAEVNRLTDSPVTVFQDFNSLFHPKSRVNIS